MRYTRAIHGPRVSFSVTSPAPRPLERVGVQLASDGTLEVDKAVKFQEEKGQWEDAKSFVDGSIA